MSEAVPFLHSVAESPLIFFSFSTPPMEYLSRHFIEQITTILKLVAIRQSPDSRANLALLKERQGSVRVEILMLLISENEA